MKKIVFNLKREWYDKIASGEKIVEYRKVNAYWMSRLVDGKVGNDGVLRGSTKRFDVAVFRLGYSRKYPDITRRIVNIDIGPCPYDGWEGTYFRIHFEGVENRVANARKVKGGVR